jgi:hypothetical protein
MRIVADAFGRAALPAVLPLGCAQIADLPGDPRLVVDEQWGCLSEPQRVPVPRQPTVHIIIEVCDFLRDCTAPITGVTGKLCGKADVGCSQPLLEGITDVGGTLEFDVPTGSDGFDGYLSLSGPSELCTNREAFGLASMYMCSLLPECDGERPDSRCMMPLYSPALLFFAPPVTGERPPTSIPLVSSAAVPAVLMAAGSAFDPALGTLILRGRDCTGAPAAGIRYELVQPQEQSTRLYIRTGILSPAASSTDISGLGGFAGLRPGFVDVEAYNGAGEHIGEAGVQIAAFTITYSGAGPY